MSVGRLRVRGLMTAGSWTALALAAPAGAMAAEAADMQPTPVDEQITVIGTRIVDIQPERELDQQGIESYGQSTIDELLGEIAAELGEDERPLILVNGERVDELDDIGGLPVEALENVKVLPRGSAVRVGGRPGQRVVDLRLKKMVRSATLLVAPKIATDGDWRSGRGEAVLTYIRNSTRANLAFKARDESDLLESERDIAQPTSVPPFAIGGNVVGFPDTQGEVDPLLSAAAGEIVTVAPIPGSPSPTLLDFVPAANQAAVSDLGEFRTLRPETRNYDLNGTVATRLAPWLTGNFGVRLSRTTRRSLRGLPSALFVLSPTNASSPFSTTVALAQYGTDPLATRTERNSGQANLSLNGRFGEWTSFFTAKYLEAKDETRTERQSVSGTVPLADGIDAFGSELFDLVPIRTDRAEGRTTTKNARLSFTGPLFTLPAGEAQATFEGGYEHDRLRSKSDFALISQDRRFSRSETLLRTAIDLPITTSDGFGGIIGNLNMSGEFSRVHFSDAGNIHNHQLGVAWEPHPRLRFSADVEETGIPASVQILGNPTVVTSGVRTFDPLTGDTVDVTQIYGGNPDLQPEKTTVRRLSGLVRLVESLNLQLNAEYTSTTERNFVSALPEASAAVMLAFPERFVRNLDGVLTIVDLRPVNFDRRDEKRFRYGVSLNLSRGGLARPVPLETPGDDNADDDATPSAAPARTAIRRGPPPTRIGFTASHSIVLRDEIIIRSGLPAVDLLDGGAIGIGGGRVQHQLDATASLTSGGSGIRVTANWRGKSTLNALNEGTSDRLSFSPVFNLGIRAFADLHRFLPQADWTRGMRLSLNVVNATNDRQEVRDSSGDTPLRYQPGYRDPVGRTIEVELRKVF